MPLVRSLILVLILTLIAWLGALAPGMQFVLGIIIPYAAIMVFLVGITARIIKWARAPVPFRIPTTSGQEKSLPWIKNNPLDNPHTGWGTAGRMALEILLFRSLFKNTRTELKDGPKLVYGSNKYLWAAGLAFHWSFLVIFLRHFKFFVEPTPQFVSWLQNLDGFFQIGLPVLYITDVFFLGAVSWLFLRRIWDDKLRYISLAADYFPLFLLLGIGTTGVLMRYFVKVDVTAVKELSWGLASLQPHIPAGINPLFFIHFFLVCSLIVYFPFSKLMHFGGVFLSPTRNLANSNRRVRHINPWNPAVKIHTYQEYEAEFHEVMKAAGLPLEKEQ